MATEPTADPIYSAPPAQPDQTSMLYQEHPVAMTALKMLERSVVWMVNLLGKPKPRAVAVGLVLIIIGAFFIDHSVWTFPLVIIGAIMIIVAWVGVRLEGRFGIEWSDGGAGFELRARFRPAKELHVKKLSVASPAASSTNYRAPTGASTDTQPREDDDTDVIEGEAHTIEIDVEELKALVAAAERANNATATTNGTAISWQEVPTRHGREAENN